MLEFLTSSSQDSSSCDASVCIDLTHVKLEVNFLLPPHWKLLRFWLTLTLRFFCSLWKVMWEFKLICVRDVVQVFAWAITSKNFLYVRVLIKTSAGKGWCDVSSVMIIVSTFLTWEERNAMTMWFYESFCHFQRKLCIMSDKQDPLSFLVEDCIYILFKMVHFFIHKEK